MAVRNRNAVTAGLFIVLSIVLILAIVLGIQGLSGLLRPKVVRKALFHLKDDVGGLRGGDEVRVGGVRVGEVQDIDIVEPTEAGEQPTILVSFTIPRRYKLRQGVRLRIQTSVTNTSNLNIESVGTGDVLSADAVLPGAASVLTEALGDVRGTLDDVKAVAGNVRQNTVPRLNDALERTSEMMAKTRDLIGDSTGDFKGTVANLNATTGELKEKMPGLLEKATGLLTRLDQTIAHATDAMKDVQSAAGDIKQIGASAREILVDNRGKLDGMIASLKTTSDNLKGASTEIRRSPWRLLYKPSGDEQANLNLFDAARHFGEGAQAMSDAAIALRDASRDPRADPERIKKLIEALDASFKSFTEVERQLYDKAKE